MKLNFFSIILLCSILLFMIGCERESNNILYDDGIPPAIPENVLISFSNDGEILIEWNSNSENDFKEYKIFRSENDSTHFIFLTSSFINYYLDDSLSYDSFYFYKISSIDNYGRESEYSKIVFAKPINKYSPYKPRYLTINARNYEGKISIYLNWQPNFESDISSYKIFRSTEPNFSLDSINEVGISYSFFFNDTFNLKIFKDYYYKIKAVDKGGLLSKESDEVNDIIFPIPQVIFPENNSIVQYFDFFKIRALGVPTNYKIILQTNELFGEIWSKEFFTNQTDTILYIKFDASYIYNYTSYYWRVITYSQFSSEPNSISALYKFTIKP